jgi:hypothetical protein
MSLQSALRWGLVRVFVPTFAVGALCTVAYAVVVTYVLEISHQATLVGMDVPAAFAMIVGAINGFVHRKELKQ